MIYLGMSAWHGMWKSRHQLMSRYALEMPVLYVEPWVSLNSIRKHRSGLLRVLRDIRKPVATKINANLSVMGASAARPVSGSRQLMPFTQRRWLEGIRRAARFAGIERPILWISRPEMGFVIGQLGEQFSIYHIVDEYIGYTGLTDQHKSRLTEQEADVLGKVDLTVAASPELVAAKAGPGRDIVLLENGVDPGEYRSALEKRDAPDDIAGIPGPRLGYSGLIGKRLDLQLIADVAQKRKDWSIVFIGRTDTRECASELAVLENLPNVHFLGEKSPQDVARYIAEFDVGLLPYAVNLETEHISPIKMYEYWAAGKPVVGTRIPATRRNSVGVRTADTADGFVEQADLVLKTIDESERDRVMALAEVNSWQARVDAVSAEIFERMPKPGNQVSGG
jgi:UDP-galactopyranose mutase